MFRSEKRLVSAGLFWGILALAGMAPAATYQVEQAPLQWESVSDSRTQSESATRQFQYGDDESLAFDLPWPILFYGRYYSQITVDTNGTLWFDPTDPANLPVGFDLIDGGNGPVASAWNGDHSSYCYGGVFIEHKTAPERVVVQWTTESWNAQGQYRPSRFQMVLGPDNTLSFNYREIGDPAANDAGSGISTGDGIRYYSLTQAQGPVPTLGQTTLTYLHDFDEDGLADLSDPDDDNDGVNDAQEIASGTDPFDPASTPAVPVPALDSLALALTAVLLALLAMNRRRREI